jgi:hypothetical protein
MTVGAVRGPLRVGVLPPYRRTGLPPKLAGVAQLVEHQPSKLRVAGSSPVARLQKPEKTEMERALA